MRRHTPTLYAHPEQDNIDDEVAESWQGLPSRQSPFNITPSSSARHRLSSTRSRLNSKDSPLSNDGAYDHFVRTYRPGKKQAEDDRNDPDSHYFQRGLGQLVDAGDSDDEGYPRISHSLGDVDNLDMSLQESPPIQPTTKEEKERLEWQSLLASVLSGQVLRSEKTRMKEAMDKFPEGTSNFSLNVWLGIRARLHGRTAEEERRRIDELRASIVPGLIQDICSFHIPADAEAKETALDQVHAMLRRLDVAHSLYPSLKAFIADNPNAAERDFEKRCDALYTWSTVLTTARRQTALLQRWTGSDTLDVTQPFTSTEMPIGSGVARAVKEDGTEIADGSSFVDRLLKEESMQRTFEKGFLTTVHSFIGIARDAQVNMAQIFEEMNLPNFSDELVPLISFPTKIAQASLRIRLDYVQKLRDPEVLIIDQVTEDIKLGIGLACMLKRQYEAFLAPDPGGKWALPQSISSDYDATIHQALIVLFRLLHWKLKSGVKAIYFKETEVLEGPWPTFNDVSATTAGGSRLVAEQLCGLANKLIIRVSNYFDTQLKVPASYRAGADGGLIQPGQHRSMSSDDVISWYTKILDSVRLRYRKLQRFARMLTQRFSNSAEYNLENFPLDVFISTLVQTEHVLVYTRCFEEDGTYIIASSGLRDQPDAICRIMTEAFLGDEIGADTLRMPIDGEEDYEEEGQYILLLSPRSQFLWNGIYLVLEVPPLDFDLKDNRVRLVAGGPQRRLALAKQTFRSLFYEEEEDEDSMQSIIGPLHCIAEQQAHLPSVSRELRRIARATNKLAESIAESVHRVRDVLRNSDGYQDLLESWYGFASEHGQHAQKYMDRQSQIKFNALLIKLAISWVSFICDDCDPTDRRTFRWAVNALEFTLTRTRGAHVLQLPADQFQKLRTRVASCMTLLVSHFDVLGARSNLEAQKEKERQEELIRTSKRQLEELEAYELLKTSPKAEPVLDSGERLFWERVNLSLQDLEESRGPQRPLGRVLDSEKPEDRSLVFLASAGLNFSMRWQQRQLIGAGAFGSVYLAVNLETGNLMAVKEIKFQELAGVPNLYAQIKEELSVMEMVHHANVVEYYGIEVHRDKVYIFEEYCQGGSLASLLEHGGGIEDERVLQVYTMQMLEGLDYLHSRGVVHRDVKPDNILLDHMGVLKFADFGASKIFAKNHKTTHRSRRPVDYNHPHPVAGEVLGAAKAMNNSLTGTPMYMSPEVIKNDPRGRHGAMDLWSLGCVVLELCTGRKPWSHLDNEWAIMFAIGSQQAIPSLPTADQVGELCLDFIKQCFTIDPVLRPSAAELKEHPWMEEFKEALRNYEEMVEPPAVMPEEGEFENATVARQATILQEKEVEEMHNSPPLQTPSDSEMNTPTNLDTQTAS